MISGKNTEADRNPRSGKVAVSGPRFLGNGLAFTLVGPDGQVGSAQLGDRKSLLSGLGFHILVDHMQIREYDRNKRLVRDLVSGKEWRTRKGQKPPSRIPLKEAEISFPLEHSRTNNMNKSEYFQECQKRNQELRNDIHTFHRKFPPVFFWKYKSRAQLPNALKPLLEPVPGHKDTFMGNAQSFGYWYYLYSTTLALQGFERLTSRTSGGKYWQIIQKRPVDWVTSYNKLCQKWPMINEASIRWPMIEAQSRPAIMTCSIPFNLEEWGKNLLRLARAAKIVIPIYENTSRDDINWEYIVALQKENYGTKLRSTPGRYELKIKVWDTVKKMGGNFSRTARELEKPLSTVRDLYDAVHKDILGYYPTKRKKSPIKEITLEEANAHVRGCSRCQKVMDPGQMCEPFGRVIESYINQDEVKQKELIVGSSPELYPRSGMKGPLPTAK